MFKKIFAFLFPKEKPIPPQVKKTNKKPKPKVEASRIGEIGEHKINIQLSQFSKENKIISDFMISNPKSSTGYSQIDHMLINPYGIFVIETKNYNGTIKGTTKSKQWTVNGRFKMYNPIYQNYGHIEAIKLHIPLHERIIFISVVSFTMRARFSIDPDLRQIASNTLIVYDTELTGFINRKILRLKAENPTKILTTEEVEQIYQAIETKKCTDPLIRSAHNVKIKALQ